MDAHPLSTELTPTDPAPGFTDVVLAAMAGTQSPRLKEVLESLVRHLHAFAREVRLTEDELGLGVDFVNRVGQATNDTHNEAMLLADVLGVSSLVCRMTDGSRTTSALLGPFWRMNAPATANGDSIVRSPSPGERLRFQGRVVDPHGAPVPGASVDVWQASPVGLYDNQDPTQAAMNLRGSFTTDGEGRFAFESVRPAGYPVPTHGPVGELLSAQARSPQRPAHIHFLLYRQGFETLITQLFVDTPEALQADVVFGVDGALVAEPEAAQDPDGPVQRLTYTFTLQPGRSRLPRPPIK